jgi:hypothetical protein
VDITVDSLTKTDYYITNIENGEWLQYTLNVLRAGNYILKFKCFAKDTTGKFSILVNKNMSQAIDIPKTTEWETIEVKNIKLNKGENKLRLVIDQGGFDFRSVEFVEVK